MKRVSLTQHLVEEQRHNNSIPAELRLLIDACVLFAQPLVHAGELGGEIRARFLALVRCLEHRHRDDLFELFRHVLALRVDRRRRGVHDLVQQLDQVAGAERPDAGQQLVHDGAQ